MEQLLLETETPLEKKFKASLADISERYYPGTIAKIKGKYLDLWEAIKAAEAEMEVHWVPWNVAFENWKSLLNEAIIIAQSENPTETGD